MKYFLLKSCIFLSLIPVLIYLLSFVPKRKTERDYLEGMVQKHERLNSIASPKIIIASGSNMAFGLDSEMIEEEFSLPVVNLSLHAGLGVSFILEELKNSINNGDVVLLSFEYFLGNGNIRILRQITEYFPQAADFYELDYSTTISLGIEDTKENIKNSIRGFISPRLFKGDVVYSKNAFNKYGDVIINNSIKKRRSKLNGIKTKKRYRYWDKIEDINQFYEYATKMNTSVFYLFPTYAQSAYELNKKKIELLRDDLYRDLKVEIINEPSSFVFHDSLYYDTVYHLNKNGKEKRTTKLIELIKKNQYAQQSLKIQ